MPQNPAHPKAHEDAEQETYPNGGKEHGGFAFQALLGGSTLSLQRPFLWMNSIPNLACDNEQCTSGNDGQNNSNGQNFGVGQLDSKNKSHSAQDWKEKCPCACSLFNASDELLSFAPPFLM